MDSNKTHAIGYAIVPFLWLGHWIVDFMLGIWPVYKSLIHLDLAVAGAIVAVGACLGEGLQLLFGSLSDRGYRKSLIIFGVLAATSSAFLSFFSSYLMLFFFYLLTCVGSGAFHPSAAGLVNSLIPERRALMMTIFASGGLLGLASSQLVFTYLYQGYGGNTLILAIPTVLVVGFALCYRFSRMEQPKAEQKKKVSFKEFKDLFVRRDTRLLYISQVANQTLMWGMIFMLPDMLQTLGHSEWVCFGGGHSCLILGSALMVVPAGYLADRYSPRTVILGATLLSFAAFYFIIFSGSMPALMALGMLFVLGASLGVVNPVSVAWGTRLVPDKPGVISAFLMGLVWCVSEVLGPGGAGLLTTLFDDGAPVKAMAVLGVFFLVALYAIIALPREKQAVVAINVPS